MIKKIAITTIVVFLAGAVVVGAYDAYQGRSTLSLPVTNTLPSDSANQGQGQGRGQGQGQGQGRGNGQGQGSGKGQGQGQQGQGQGRGQGQGQGAGKGYGQANGSGKPQAMAHDWVTLIGVVDSANSRNLTIETEEQEQIIVSLGRPGFAEQQEVTFNPGDAVTILGFEGENGTFQGGEITNETTQATLHLRDPNGRPLWAGQGQGNRGGNGQGQATNSQ